MGQRILILGAGFGGLELATTLSEALGDAVDVTLIDKSDAFVFGYSKLDVMFGRTTPDAVRLPYRDIAKPGVRVLQETVTAIDPEARRVETDAGDPRGRRARRRARRRLRPRRDAGARRGRQRVLLRRRGDRARATCCPPSRADASSIGVCGAPFKCPPAPSECALLLHDHLVERGVRDACDITLVIPFGTPVPPSPDTSSALLEAFAEREHRVRSRAPRRRRSTRRASVAVLDDDSELPFDLFLGVPKHRAPDVVDRERDDRGRLRPGRLARRSRRGIPACTRSATSPRSACRRPACSPRARRASSRGS